MRGWPDRHADRVRRRRHRSRDASRSIISISISMACSRPTSFGEPSNATLLNYLSRAVRGHPRWHRHPRPVHVGLQFRRARPSTSLPPAIRCRCNTRSCPTTVTRTGTGNGVVTFNIAGSNDAPTLDRRDAGLGQLADNSDPAGSTVSRSLRGQVPRRRRRRELPGRRGQRRIVPPRIRASGSTRSPAPISGLISGRSATRCAGAEPDTLIRFVPADGFTGTPASLGVHALDDTYTGAITDSSSPATIDLTATGTGGTTPVSHELTTIDTEVTAPLPTVLLDRHRALPGRAQQRAQHRLHHRSLRSSTPIPVRRRTTSP